MNQTAPLLANASNIMTINKTGDATTKIRKAKSLSKRGLISERYNELCLRTQILIFYGRDSKPQSAKGNPRLYRHFERGMCVGMRGVRNHHKGLTIVIFSRIYQGDFSVAINS
jgi:hypothetical protein